MTKDVILTIRGFQFDIDSKEPMEVITAAEYYMKNGRHYVLYTEIVPDSKEEIKNILKISKDRIDVIKHGTQSVHMIFEPAKKNVSCYGTPFGSMMVGIHTLDINLSETDMNIDTKIRYALEINDAHVTDCEIMLNIKSKDDKSFKL